MTDGLEFVRDGDVARLTFARPDKKNAIAYDMWSAIPAIVTEVDHDPALKVLLISGAGQDFSAGADISEFGTLRSSAEGAKAYDKVVEGAVSALSGLRKPTVAMIRGNCVGAGCQVCVACDFRFAARGARFGITPAKLGIVYDLRSTRQLMSLIGPANARFLLLSGELIPADRAREIGLLNEVFAPDELEESIGAFIRTLCARSQASIRGMNRIIEKILDGQQDSDMEVEEIRLAALHGEDYAEGIDAFLSRRAPRFTHR